MSGRQRTFELIPASLLKSNGPKPPMTSKAAKKAYQQATRGPRVSRAEQWRLERQELEQQKKDSEREKALARARAAREKKAERANLERIERKKVGMPEPSKYVRASQPTISRFVNNAGKRTLQAIEYVTEDSEGSINEDDIKSKKSVQRLAKRVAVEESDNEFGEFPSFSQADILEKLDSSAVSSICGSSGPASSAAQDATALQEQPQPAVRKPLDDGCEVPAFPNFATLANTQLLSEAAEAAPKPEEVEPAQHSSRKSLPRCITPNEIRKSQRVHNPTTNLSRSKSRSQDGPEIALGEKILKASATTSRNLNQQSVASSIAPMTRPNQGQAASNRPLEAISVNMQPPPKRTSIKNNSALLAQKAPQPRLPQRIIATPALELLSKLPPSSTQAFLENNLEMFLPSPSQEVRELLENVADDFPSNTQVAQEIGPCNPLTKMNINDSSREILVRSQDSLRTEQILSCQAISPLLIDESCGGEDEAQQTANESPELTSFSRRETLDKSWRVRSQRHSKPESLRPQQRDLKMETQSWLPDKIYNSRRYGRGARIVLDDCVEEDEAGSVCETPVQKLQSSRDTVRALRIETTKSTHSGSTSVPNLEKGAPVASTSSSESTAREPEAVMRTDLKETRQVPHTAVASPTVEPVPTTGIHISPQRIGRGRFFEEKDEDIMHAVLQESKLSAKRDPQLQKVPIKRSPKRTKRNLARVQSTQTDYGDEGFSDCEDLLALL